MFDSFKIINVLYLYDEDLNFYIKKNTLII
jgi:hypothetical protein